MQNPQPEKKRPEKKKPKPAGESSSPSPKTRKGEMVEDDDPGYVQGKKQKRKIYR